MIVILLFIYAVCAMPLHVLMFYRDFRGTPTLSAREDMGSALGLGVVSAFLGPIGTFLVLCMTGFAQHGIVTQRGTNGKASL